MNQCVLFDWRSFAGRTLRVCVLLPLALTIAVRPVNGGEPDRSLPGESAEAVVGQPDFGHPFPNRTDGRGLIAPGAVAVDRSVTPYRLYVADPGNHRVLGYLSPAASERPVTADIVIGQADLDGAFLDTRRAGRDRLHTPVGLAVDDRGNLYVCDQDAHRVVVFDRPFETDALADAVFGQGGNFDTLEVDPRGIGPGTLNHPGSVAFDARSDTLWVADTGHHRVLGYRSPHTSDVLADIVIGQPDFATDGANTGGRSARSLDGPLGVSVLGDTLAVADTGNHRVLLYRHPATTHAAAYRVLGQDGSFATSAQGCSPFRLRLPAAVTLVPSAATASDGVVPPGETCCDVLVSDTGNHRVLLFKTGRGFSGQPAALWGQGRNLHGGKPNAGGLGPGTLQHPLGTAWVPDNSTVASRGTLWIADAGNQRVLGFDGGLVDGAEASGRRQADHVIGQIDLMHATYNFMDGMSLAYPHDVAIDRSVKPNRLYICDFENNRVLGYGSVDDLGPNRRPDIVLGQPDAYTNDPGTSATALCLPAAIAVDTAGGVFVADRQNNRVLWFAAPFDTDVRADKVFGQPDFTSGAPNTGGISSRSLNRPEGVAVDAEGNLYVSDTRNHRVVRYDDAVSSEGAADRVWGQGGSFVRGEEFGGVGVRADTFSYPFGVDIRPDGLLAVADTNNHRVLVFDIGGGGTGRAIRVFGQKRDFTSREDNCGGCSAASLSGPEGVVWGRKGLYVADTANCRIVYYGEGGEGDPGADRVYGQGGSFRMHGPRPDRTDAGTLWFPSGLDLDNQGNLYVADRQQSRVLIFTSSGRQRPSTGRSPTGGK